MNLTAFAIGLCGLFLQTDLIPIPEPTMQEGTPIPGCAATAAWSLILAEGGDVTLAEVTYRFRELNPAYDRIRVSMLELRGLLQSYGIETEAIRSSTISLNSITRPCILFFRPGRWSDIDTTGHFVFLASVTDESATVIDWNGKTGRPARTIQRTELEQLWDGEAIVVARTSAHHSWSIVSLVAIVLAGATSLFRWRGRYFSRRLSRGMPDEHH